MATSKRTADPANGYRCCVKLFSKAGRQPDWHRHDPGRNPAAPRPAFTATSKRRSNSRSHSSIDGKSFGPAIGLRPRSSGVRTSPEARLLAIFDVFDGWFHKRSFEGCSFINVLLESKVDSPVRQAAAVHLAKIRAIVRDLAEEAKLREPEKFAQAWHMLMKGSIMSAGEGNRNAARDAKYAAQLILAGWKHRRKSRLPRTAAASR